MDTVLSGTAGGSRVKGLLNRLGIDVRYSRSVGLVSVEIKRLAQAAAKELPPLLEGPLEALYYSRGGKPASFSCPIEKCVTVTGLNFGTAGWHPFSATVEEMTRTDRTSYRGSTLHKYYSGWQPATAREALLDPEVAPPSFRELPPHLIYLFPWSSRSIDEADQAIRKWTQDDHLEHSGPRLSDMGVSLKDQGPVSSEVGAFEYQRLRNLYSTLQTQGFDRGRGDINVLLIKRGEDFRFLNFGGGLHRTAALKALGYTHVPARPLNQLMLDIDDIAYWPQVHSGYWTEKHARRYVDHLFDFDALGWARSLGLTQQYMSEHAAFRGNPTIHSASTA